MKDNDFSNGKLKKRYKLYKAGKRMLIAPLVFAGLFAFSSTTVKADTNNVQPDSSIIVSRIEDGGSSAATQNDASSAASSVAVNSQSAASAESVVAPSSVATP